jgi:septal ring factor EnvC (AmiA/AmiB activator)
MTYLSVSPRPASARAIPVLSLSLKAAAEVRERRRNCEKDVKLERAKPESPLESTKDFKNELKTNSKSVQKTRKKLEKCAKNTRKAQTELEKRDADMVPWPHP